MFRKVYILLFLIITVILYFQRHYIYSRLVVPDIVEWERPSQKMPPLAGQITVRQYFRPNFNGLFRIGFALDYQEAGEVKIEVALKEEDTERELFKEIMPLNRFPRKKMRRFSFSPQWDSASKAYILTVGAPAAAPQTELRLLSDVWPFFHMGTGGKLYFGENEFPGELSMVSECRVKVKADEFISFGRRFMADKVFAIFYLGTIALAIGWLGISKKAVPR